MNIAWYPPMRLNFVETDDSDSWSTFPYGTTGVPTGKHVGAFAHQRKFHIHEGVDLYAPQGQGVCAVEQGEVVAVIPFTGPKAGSTWWHNTEAVLVEGKSGVVVYGEIEASGYMKVGRKIQLGDHLGYVKRVLILDKGRPTSMLHMELHTPGTRVCPEWVRENERPPTLLDPTPFLLEICTPLPKNDSAKSSTSSQ